MQSEYIGCPSIAEIDVIASDSLSPAAFFAKYISTRTPVKFSNHLVDKKWKVSKDKWNHDYFRKKCSKDMKLKIEFRDDNNDKFGKAQEKIITFHEFLDELDHGTDTLYLTTQNLDTDSEGRPHIMAAPLTSFTHDFPTVPDLFQSLVPANINLWYGQTKTFSTSGLHHDYHDNLYIMLKGEKLITLYSPSDIDSMYVAGEVVKVHPNGRICYKGKMTRADGADLQAEKALEASLRLKAAAAKLAEAETQAAEVNDAEDELDRALEEVLDAECGDEEDGDDEEDEDDEDNYGDDPFDLAVQDMEDEDEGEGDASGGDDEEENDKEEESGDEDAAVGVEESKGQEQQVDGRGAKRKASAPACGGPSKRTHPEATPKALPVSFSKVDTRQPDEVLQQEFPRFVEARRRGTQVMVKEGEMLFIPAGWFHEVQSRGERGHMAFNYWFHPPDNYQPAPEGAQRGIPFEKPYASDFWAKDMSDRGLF